MQTFQVTENRTGNFSYPSSSSAVVFVGHLSARSRVLGIDRKSPAIGNCT